MLSSFIDYLKDIFGYKGKQVISSKMSTTAINMEERCTSPFVFPPSSDQRSVRLDHLPRDHLPRDHHRESFRRQLSRGLSSRAKQFRESTRQSACNTTACAISVCFTMSFLALILAILNSYAYTQIHGFGPLSPAGTHGAPQMDRQHASPHPVTQATREAMPETDPTHLRDEQDGGCKAYAHILGKGAGVGRNDDGLDRLIVWRDNVTHNVDFRDNSGLLRILEPGFYYVYSQIYFSDSEESAITVENGSEQPMLFSTRRNRAPLMQSVIPFKEFSTKYHGGIFHLQRGDEIEVHVSNNELRINLSGENTYFGVFLLGSSLH